MEIDEIMHVNTSKQWCTVHQTDSHASEECKARYKKRKLSNKRRIISYSVSHLNPQRSRVLTITVSINKATEGTETVVDTGSSISLINKQFAQQLQLKQNHKHRVHITSVEGKLAQTHGTVNVPIALEHITIYHKCHILDSQQFKLLLGTDFLDRHKAQIDFNSRKIKSPNFKNIAFKEETRNNTVLLCDMDNPFIAYATESLTIQP